MMEKIKKRPLRSSRFFKLEKGDTEHKFGKSVTIPDQSYTIKEVYDNFSHLSVDLQRQAVTMELDDSDASFDAPDLSKLGDFADVAEFTAQHGLLVSEKERKAKAFRSEIEEAARLAELKRKEDDHEPAK